MCWRSLLLFIQIKQSLDRFFFPPSGFSCLFLGLLVEEREGLSNFLGVLQILFSAALDAALFLVGQSVGIELSDTVLEASSEAIDCAGSKIKKR